MKPEKDAYRGPVPPGVKEDMERRAFVDRCIRCVTFVKELMKNPKEKAFALWRDWVDRL